MIKQVSISHEKQDCNQSRTISDNILNTTDYLFGSTIGWNEIPNDISRYESSTNLLDVSDATGYSFLNTTKESDNYAMKDCNNYSFEGLVVTMQSYKFKSTRNLASTSICHIFRASTICIPISAIQNIADHEISQVAVQYKIDNAAKIFPSTFEILRTTGKESLRYSQNENLHSESSLNEFLIGLAINNNQRIETIPGEPIEVKFRHEDNKVTSKYYVYPYTAFERFMFGP